MTTPYKNRQIERIIASAIARRFAHKVDDVQTEKMLEAQKAVMDAQHTYRMLIEDVINSILR